LRDKVRLGLYDDPFLDPGHAERTAGRADFRAAGEQAQRRAIALLRNQGGTLPLREGVRLYVEGIDPAVAAGYGQVVGHPGGAVAHPGGAVAACLRLDAPFEPRGGFLEQFFGAGSLEYPPDERERLRALLRRVPAVVDVFLDRPAVLTELAEHAAALVADFG